MRTHKNEFDLRKQFEVFPKTTLTYVRLLIKICYQRGQLSKKSTTSLYLLNSMKKENTIINLANEKMAVRTALVVSTIVASLLFGLVF